MANGKFNLDEELLKAIAISISEGIGIDFIDARKQLDTFTQNSSPTLIWDLINSNLKKDLEKIMFVFTKSNVVFGNSC